MITPELITGKTPEEVAQLLRDTCIRTERANVKRYFQPEELDQFRVDLSKLSIKRDDLEVKLKAQAQPLKLEIGQCTKEIKQHLQDLRKEYTEQEEEVFLIDDQDNGEMIIYSSTGSVVETRRLLPNERQTRIRDINKAS